MVDIKELTDELTKLQSQIKTVLRLSNYREYDDLSDIHYSNLSKIWVYCKRAVFTPLNRRSQRGEGPEELKAAVFKIVFTGAGTRVGKESS